MLVVGWCFKPLNVSCRIWTESDSQPTRLMFVSWVDKQYQPSPLKLSVATLLQAKLVYCFRPSYQTRRYNKYPNRSEQGLHFPTQTLQILDLFLRWPLNRQHLSFYRWYKCLLEQWNVLVLRTGTWQLRDLQPDRCWYQTWICLFLETLCECLQIFGSGVLFWLFRCLRWIQQNCRQGLRWRFKRLKFGKIFIVLIR